MAAQVRTDDRLPVRPLLLHRRHRRRRAVMIEPMLHEDRVVMSKQHQVIA